MTKGTAAAIGKWLKSHSTGASSETMAAVMLGAELEPGEADWPLDPADFNRCLKLVKLVPEVRTAFPKIRRLNKQWRAVIDNWEKLEKSFVAEVGWDWSKGSMAKKTYDKMKALGL